MWEISLIRKGDVNYKETFFFDFFFFTILIYFCICVIKRYKLIQTKPFPSSALSRTDRLLKCDVYTQLRKNNSVKFRCFTNALAAMKFEIGVTKGAVCNSPTFGITTTKQLHLATCRCTKRHIVRTHVHGSSENRDFFVIHVYSYFILFIVIH